MMQIQARNVEDAAQETDEGQILSQSLQKDRPATTVISHF